jgi:hypothetical protein
MPELGVVFFVSVCILRTKFVCCPTVRFADYEPDMLWCLLIYLWNFSRTYPTSALHHVAMCPPYKIFCQPLKLNFYLEIFIWPRAHFSSTVYRMEKLNTLSVFKLPLNFGMRDTSHKFVTAVFVGLLWACISYRCSSTCNCLSRSRNAIPVVTISHPVHRNT